MYGFTTTLTGLSFEQALAKTLAALGVEPVMTRGTVRRQRDMAGKADLFSQEKEAAQ